MVDISTVGGSLASATRATPPSQPTNTENYNASEAAKQVSAPPPPPPPAPSVEEDADGSAALLRFSAQQAGSESTARAETNTGVLTTSQSNEETTDVSVAQDADDAVIEDPSAETTSGALFEDTEAETSAAAPSDSQPFITESEPAPAQEAAASTPQPAQSNLSASEQDEFRQAVDAYESTPLAGRQGDLKDLLQSTASAS